MPGGRPKKYFNSDELAIVDQASAVSEDVISNWFQLTISSWKKYRYDIRTLRNLESSEVVTEVFAQILRYSRPSPPDGMREGDFYRICIQDHNILRALRREPELELLPLLVYVITHELVHIVRFYKFFQFFHADEEQRATEEIRVHKLTYEMLLDVSVPKMETIFDFYHDHREFEGVSDLAP